MKFLNKEKSVIVPHASTLFITANGQAYAITRRREAEKERVLPILRFTKNKEVGHLATLKRDREPEGIMPLTWPRKLVRRKRARTRVGCKCANDRYAEQFNATHRPSQLEETPPGDEATQEPTIRRPKGNDDVARSGGEECHEPRFQRVLEYSRILHNALEPFGIH